MSKLIKYRIIAALQFFLIFFFIMLVSDYTQYEAKMFDAKINTVYANGYDYLDCRVSDYLIRNDYWKSPFLQNGNYFSFYDHFEFDLEKNDRSAEVGYMTPTFCLKLPDNVTWIEGTKPSTSSEIALGEELYKIMEKYCSQPITIGSRITLKPVSLIKDSLFIPKEVTITGIYSSPSTVLLMNDFKYKHLIRQDEEGDHGFLYEDYNQFNESFCMWPFYDITPDFATPNNILVEVPKEKNDLVNMYKEDRRVRYCIDNFNTDRYRDSKLITSLDDHKKALDVSIIVFSIISAFSLFLLFLFLFASTQLAIIQNEKKLTKSIVKKELLFYALILLGGGLIFTIYTLVFPWSFIVQPILISIFSFIGIVILNWLLVFIWLYKELINEQ